MASTPVSEVPPVGPTDVQIPFHFAMIDVGCPSIEPNVPPTKRAGPLPSSKIQRALGATPAAPGHEDVMPSACQVGPTRLATKPHEALVSTPARKSSGPAPRSPTRSALISA